MATPSPSPGVRRQSTLQPPPPPTTPCVMAKKPRTPDDALSPALAIAWSQTLDIAVGIRELRPWEHFAPDAVLGVRDPVSGETDWCTVMGHDDEVYGIAIYGGDAGYETLYRILHEEVDEFDAPIIQRCTTLIFGTSAGLLPATKRLLKGLGRSFRGAAAWPELLVHTPGLLPAPPRDEATLRRIANALTGLAKLAPWATDDATGGACQVPGHAWATTFPFGDADRRTAPLPKVGPRPVVTAPFDQLAATKLRSSSSPRRGRWLVDWFSGMGVVDGPEAQGQPFFTTHLFLLDIDSDLMVGVQVGRVSTVMDDLQKLVLDTGARLALPNALLVRRRELVPALQPLAQALGVPIEHAPELAEVTQHVYGEMMEFLGG